MLARVTTTIYLEDTDAGGIVYHASYLRFMERARTEALRAAGFEQSVTFQADLSFVLHSMTLRFLTPAHLDDEVEATCELIEGKGATLTFGQQVRGKKSGQMHCESTVTVACIKLSTRRPRRIPAPLLERLESAMRPPPGASA